MVFEAGSIYHRCIRNVDQIELPCEVVDANKVVANSKIESRQGCLENSKGKVEAMRRERHNVGESCDVSDKPEDRTTFGLASKPNFGRTERAVAVSSSKFDGDVDGGDVFVVKIIRWKLGNEVLDSKRRTLAVANVARIGASSRSLRVRNT